MRSPARATVGTCVVHPIALPWPLQALERSPLVEQSRELGIKVKGGLRKRKSPFKYLLSGSLRCEACRASFALSNATRYQCSSHHEGGPDACEVALSVPRDRIERIFIDYMAGPELPMRLSEIEARWASSAPLSIDSRPRIDELCQEIAHMVKAITSGLLSDALAARLKAAEAERAQLLPWSTSNLSPAGRLGKALRNGLIDSGRSWRLVARWRRRWSGNSSEVASGYTQIRRAGVFYGQWLRQRPLSSIR